MGDETQKKQLEAAVKAFRVRLESACLPVVFNHTTPIFVEDEGKAVNFGTGVFVKIEGQPFLLTAAHVYDDINASQKTVGIAQSGKGRPGLKLVYDRVAATEP